MKTAKISSKSEGILNRIQKVSGGSKTGIIEKALIELDKNIAFKNFNQAYGQLKKNKLEWGKELQEREELEGTLNDGLEEDEY